MTQTTFSLSGIVVTPDGAAREATVYLSGKTIAQITPGRDPGADLSTDGVIVPGFIDVQVNGAYGYDFTNDAASVVAVASSLPETGVTSYVPTIITSNFETYPARLRQVREAVRANPPGAHILGVHLEGPYLSPVRKGAHPPVHIRPVNVAEIRAWADPGVVRIVTLAPELEGALEAIRVLRQAGFVVSAGHTNATFAQAMAGFEAGINWGTHLYNAMSPFQHREPGMIGALLVATVLCGLIVDGIHSHPATVQLAWKSKGVDGIVLVTDCMQAMGMAPGRYILGDHAVVVDETSARLEDGTLAGSILKMDEAIRNMMAFTGCGLAEAVHMATVTPARLLGLAQKGAIAPGFDADLVVLSPENQVTHTLVDGKVVFECRE
ncbi:MAG: N-acetylglucosamine-6-phosphate deacetylase [Chloroflexi bacterium]|nr:MAG: N-acetylglucosamine-6-phosphate deacetylase [Chloroflexota bacterium]